MNFRLPRTRRILGRGRIELLRALRAGMGSQALGTEGQHAQ